MEKLLKQLSNTFFMIFLSIFIVGCDFDIVGRKTLSWSPSSSMQKAKEIGTFVNSYRWTYIPYSKCRIDTVIVICEAFLEKKHGWNSYESDSIYIAKNSFDFVVRCKTSNKNIIFPKFIYGDMYKEKCMLQYEFRENRINQTINDTISTYVIWAPDSHFDKYGHYIYSLNDYRQDSINVNVYKSLCVVDGAVVLGVLQFIKNED